MVDTKKPGAHETKEARNRPVGNFVVYERTETTEEDREDEECEGADFVSTLGKAVHRVAHAEQAFIQRYLQCHEESNARRDGGWFFDFEENLYRAFRTGSRKLKLRKVVGL